MKECLLKIKISFIIILDQTLFYIYLEFLTVDQYYDYQEYVPTYFHHLLLLYEYFHNLNINTKKKYYLNFFFFFIDLPRLALKSGNGTNVPCSYLNKILK
jgi:hypothetical protein